MRKRIVTTEVHQHRSVMTTTEVKRKTTKGNVLSTDMMSSFKNSRAEFQLRTEQDMVNYESGFLDSGTTGTNVKVDIHDYEIPQLHIQSTESFPESKTYDLINYNAEISKKDPKDTELALDIKDTALCLNMGGGKGSLQGSSKSSTSCHSVSSEVSASEKSQKVQVGQHNMSSDQS